MYNYMVIKIFFFKELNQKMKANSSDELHNNKEVLL